MLAVALNRVAVRKINPKQPHPFPPYNLPTLLGWKGLALMLPWNQTILDSPEFSWGDGSGGGVDVLASTTSWGVLSCEWRLPILVLVGGGGYGVNIHCSVDVGCWWRQRSQQRWQRCNSKVGGRKQIGRSAAMSSLSKNSCGSSRQIIWSSRRGNVGEGNEQ
jgi:hypothetical protein